MRAHLQANGSPCTSVSPFGVWTTRPRVRKSCTQMQRGAYSADVTQRCEHAHSYQSRASGVRIRAPVSFFRQKALAWMLALVLSLRSTSLHTPGVNAR